MEYAGDVLRENLENFSTSEMTRLECYVELEQGQLASNLSRALAWQKVRTIMDRHPWFYTRNISHFYLFCCVAVMLIATFWLDWPLIGAVLGAGLPLGLLLIFLGHFLMKPHFRKLFKIIAKTGGTLNWGATKDGVSLVHAGILNEVRWSYPDFEPTSKTGQELETLIQEIQREMAACEQHFFNEKIQIQDDA